MRAEQLKAMGRLDSVASRRKDLGQQVEATNTQSRVALDAVRAVQGDRHTLRGGDGPSAPADEVAQTQVSDVDSVAACVKPLHVP